jgi:hypothetical protein
MAVWLVKVLYEGLLINTREDHIVVFGFRCFSVDNVLEVLHALVGIFTDCGTKPKGIVADAGCIHCHFINCIHFLLEEKWRKLELLEVMRVGIYTVDNIRTT